MREKTASVTVALTGKDGWVKLNAGQDVPLRVKMTPKMIERLSAGIRDKVLSPSDRAGILNDALALVKAGEMGPEALLKLLSSYATEDNYVVWEGIAAILGQLDTIMSDDEEMSGMFRTFARGIVMNLCDAVGWESKESDGHLSVLLRSIMINLLSTFCSDDDTVYKEASRRFALFLENHDDTKALPGDMRSSVFKIVLKRGGAEVYGQIKTYFDTASDSAEKRFVLGSLGATGDAKLKKATMEWATSGAIKIQDFFFPMGSVGRSSREGREISWQYFKDNFENIKAMISKASPSLMDACIVSCGGGFCTNEMADEIVAFFEEHPVPQSSRKIQQTVEIMRANAKFFGVLKGSDLAKAEFWSTL